MPQSRRQILTTYENLLTALETALTQIEHDNEYFVNLLLQLRFEVKELLQAYTTNHLI